MIARAGVGQRLQGSDHFLQLHDLLIQDLEVYQSDLFNAGALPGAVTPELQEFTDLFDLEAKITGSPDEIEDLHVSVRVDAVT